ncbi:MAG: cytochrome c biogenesis protein CcsA [Actinomycetota bacterium]
MSIGDWALLGTVVAAAIGGLAPRWSVRLDVIAALSATGLLVVLGRLFAVEAWSWAYVADHARPGTNPFLRMAGLWAGPEGSLLLWTAMVAWAAVIAASLAPPNAVAWVRRAGAGLVVGYGLVLLVTASPFERLPFPANGGLGLQPVLEHPAMVWHPPVLYAGLIGLLVSWLLAVGAAVAPTPAVEDRSTAPLDGASVHVSSSSADVGGSPGPLGLESGQAVVTVATPLALLTAGLLTGALWANVELGWGGFWAWDPIESAGLVAWLAGVGLLHAVRRPGAVTPDPRLATALALAPGLAGIGATTVTRIGVVSSVHAFADRPTLRVGLLTVAGLATAATLVAIARAGLARTTATSANATATADRTAATSANATNRTTATATSATATDRTATAASTGVAADRTTATASTGVAADRTTATAGLGRRSGPVAGRLAAVVVLTAAAVFVAAGTYEPVVEAATTGDRLAIAGRYYTRLLWPLVILGAAFAVRADRRPWAAAIGACIGVVVAPWSAGPFALAVAAAGGAVAGSAASLAARRRPGALAHLGVGVALVGVAGTVATTSTVVTAPVGTELRVDGHPLTHRSIELDDGIGVTEAVATLDYDGVELSPRLVAFERRSVSTAEMARHRSGLDEVQVLLLDGDADSARYRVNRLPRLHLFWLGGALVAVGLVQPRRRLRSRRADRVDSSEPSGGAADDGADEGVAASVGSAEVSVPEPTSTEPLP